MIIVTNDTVLGKNLKFLRESRGLSREEMAELIHMETDKLRDLEEGECFDIAYSSLKVIYDCFDGDMDQLFDELFEKNSR